MRRYPNLEVVLVVDGAPVDLSEEPRLHVHSAASMTAPYTSNLLDVRVVQFNRRVTVGEKRNAAVLARPHPIVPAGRTATPRPTPRSRFSEVKYSEHCRTRDMLECLDFLLIAGGFQNFRNT